MNPFVFDKEADPLDLIDREDLLELIMEVVQGGQNVRLTSPRRFGKTTLLKRVLYELDRVGIQTAYVDFTRTVTVEEAFARLDEAYRPLMPLTELLSPVDHVGRQ